MKSAGTNDQQPSSSKVNSTMQTTPLQWASEASTTKRHENRRRLQNLITNIYKPQMWCFETWTRTSSKTAIKKAMLEKVQDLPAPLSRHGWESPFWDILSILMVSFPKFWDIPWYTLHFLGGLTVFWFLMGEKLCRLELLRVQELVSKVTVLGWR